nr:MAG TPA: hypothetical protein [Caudoviricetes sp.]
MIANSQPKSITNCRNPSAVKRPAADKAFFT